MDQIDHINRLGGEIDALRLLVLSLVSTHPRREETMRQYRERIEQENANMLARKIADRHIEGMNTLAGILQGEIDQPAPHRDES